LSYGRGFGLTPCSTMKMLPDSSFGTSDMSGRMAALRFSVVWSGSSRSARHQLEP